MVNNKKSIMVMDAILRLVIALAALFVLVIPGCVWIRENFLDSDKKYIQSFEEFVDGINEMNLKTIDSFFLEMKKKSAIIGFKKGADTFTCQKCLPLYSGLTTYYHTITVDKPSNSECSEGACVCLCNEEFTLDDAEYDSKENIFYYGGNCKNFKCSSLNHDIVQRTIINKKENIEWKDGFLLLRDVMGLGSDVEPSILYKVQMRNLPGPIKPGDTFTEIGVCNEAMLKYNVDFAEKLKIKELDFEIEVGDCFNTP